jgi:hydroxyquinol 1,2-dioxygenase
MPDQSPITAAVLGSLAGATSPRMRHIGEALVRHLHAFVAEVEPTQLEWSQAIAFLTRTGHTCTPSRQEFILLSDVLGVSMLVDEINHRDSGATSSTVTGPFYLPDPPAYPLGADIAGNAPGTPMLVDATVRDADGAPIPGATVDTWQADDEGLCDVQRGDTGRCAAGSSRTTAADLVWGVVPSDYPIPTTAPW